MSRKKGQDRSKASPSGEGRAKADRAGKNRSPKTESSAKQPQRTVAGKLELPAFGFADEILAAQTTAAAAAVASAEAVRSAMPAADNPQRVYEFADALAAESAQRETREADVRPQRIETWITLGLGDEIYALPVEPVQEVLRVSSLTRVPHAPSPIRGVTQVRGRVIPVIDLGSRLGLGRREIGRSSRVLVVGSRGRRLGLLADRVFQVVHLDLEQAQEPPEDVVTQQSDYIFAVYHLRDQLILLLDVDRVLIVHEAAGAA